MCRNTSAGARPTRRRCEAGAARRPTAGDWVADREATLRRRLLTARATDADRPTGRPAGHARFRFSTGRAAPQTPPRRRAPRRENGGSRSATGKNEAAAPAAAALAVSGVEVSKNTCGRPRCWLMLQQQMSLEASPLGHH